MSGREQILSRIRSALRTPAPRPHPPTKTEHRAFGSQPVVALPMAGSEGFRAWLPLVGETWEEQAALFARNAETLRADFHLCADRDELRQHLLRLSAESSWQQIATYHGELTDFAVSALSLPALVTDGGYDALEMERCDAGITGCEALVAQTGSVLITSRTTGGRALTVLPPHHIVLAKREQIVPDLSAAYALLHERYAPNYPSLMGLITGPSRTGDIERILVLGAHGPKRLTILCV